MKTVYVLTKEELYAAGPFVNIRNLLERNGVTFTMMPTDLRTPRFSDLEPPWRVTQGPDGTLTFEQGEDD
jgi:hypothetical protein